MKTRHSMTISGVGALAILLMLGCDPQREAVKLFGGQGFTLLQPAREYVRPGGVLLLSGKEHEHPVYVDPPSTVADTQFSIALPLGTSSSSTPLDLALGVLSQEVKIPSGLKIQGDQPVRLKQIDVQRVRLTPEQITIVLEDSSTFIRRELLHARIFMISEVLQFKSLTISSSLNEPLQLSSTSTVPACVPAPDVTDTRSSLSELSARDISHLSTNVTVSICSDGASGLTVTAERPISFAIRADEVVMDSGGSLRVLPTSTLKSKHGLEGSILKGM